MKTQHGQLPPMKRMQIHRALPGPSGSESNHPSPPQVTLRPRQTEDHSREAVSAHQEPEIQVPVILRNCVASAGGWRLLCKLRGLARAGPCLKGVHTLTVPLWVLRGGAAWAEGGEKGVSLAQRPSEFGAQDLAGPDHF